MDPITDESGTEQPLLSIVVTSRNDDHGGDLIYRMNLFVNGLADLADRYELDTELIVVEWNPPLERSKLKQAVNWPQSRSLDIRVIEVPPEVHDQFDFSDRLPMFQMIAKNVGIRRARGQFILATNVDVLLNEELVMFLAEGKLDRGSFYRIDRIDVMDKVPLDSPIEDQLTYCRRNILRINTEYGTVYLNSQGPRVVRPRFGLIPRLANRFVRAVTPQRLRKVLPWSFRDWWVKSVHYSRPVIHTNACGDFTLMHRDHWFHLRGYAEFQMYSIHIDSLLCYAAYFAGVTQMILKDPMRLYHVEHDFGWLSQGRAFEKSPENEGTKQPAVPQLSPLQLEAWADEMRASGKPLIWNDENWGLSAERFPEQMLNKAARSHAGAQ